VPDLDAGGITEHGHQRFPIGVGQRPQSNLLAIDRRDRLRVPIHAGYARMGIAFQGWRTDTAWPVRRRRRNDLVHEQSMNLVPESLVEVERPRVRGGEVEDDP